MPTPFIAHSPFYSRLPQRKVCGSSQHHLAGRPRLANALQVGLEAATPDHLPTPAQRGCVVVGLVERVLQEPRVGRLHGAEDDLQLAVAQASHAGRDAAGGRGPALGLRVGLLRRSALHVHHGHELDAGVGLEAVQRQPLVQCLQEAQVPRQSRACGRVGARARLKDIEAAAKEEREL